MSKLLIRSALPVRSALRTVRLCLAESRVSVQIVCLARFLAGAVLSGGGRLPHPWTTAAAASGWVGLTVAIYLFNGISDRTEDVRNGSTRPIASGRLPVRTAVTVMALCAALGLLGCLAAGVATVAVAVVYLAIGYGYSARPFVFKSAFYSCAVAGIGLGLCGYTAGCLSGGGRIDLPLLVFAGFMSLWMGGVGGIAKDFSDVAGDRVAGRRSLPILVGDGIARSVLALAAVVVALGFAVAAWSFPLGTALRCCAVVLLLGAVTVAATGAGVGGGSGRSRRRLPYRSFMATQQAMHIVLGIGLLAGGLR